MMEQEKKTWSTPKHENLGSIYDLTKLAGPTES